MEDKEANISTEERTTDPINEKNKEKENDEKIINLLNNINVDSHEIETVVNNMVEFNLKLKSLKDINLFLTFEIVAILKKLNEKNNIKINLELSKTYMTIFNNDSLYDSYLLSIEKEDNINVLILIIDECISLIEKLNGFVFDQKIFNFKNKTLSLIKCIYLNCKIKITNKNILKKLEGLIDSFPKQFYSDTYNELNQDKELYQIWKSQEQDKINNFEDKFAQINNYYEQFEAFRKFVEYNSGVVTYDAVSGEDIPDNKEKEKEKKNEIDPSKIDFYQQYGLLLLKFCKYHQYIFLNKEPENKPKENEEENEDKVKVVFLLDKIKQLDDEKEEGKKGEEPGLEENKKEGKENNNEMKDNIKVNKKIENLMNEKLFVSIVESKDYNELIKKEINNYIKLTKSLEKDTRIKTIIDQMSYFLSILDIESYVPLYLTDFSKITISDNFTPSFSTNVPAGKSNEIYLETKEGENMLVYVEFSLEDKSKDITFEVNKYELKTNSFKLVFKEEKIEDTFKFFILCNGYSLYQIVFNNHYSWFTSKDVNYRIAVLKLIDKPKKGLGQNGNNKNEEKKLDDKKEIEDKIEEKPDDIGDNIFYCYFNGKNNSFDYNKINKKIKNVEEKKEDEEIVNIPVILYLNNLRIVSIQKDEIKFIEEVEEDENFIPKHFFDFQLINYIKKTLKIKPGEDKDKKIIVSIFSLNRDLSTLYKEVEEQIKALNVSTINNSISDNECINYLEKVGFYPNESLEKYNAKFKLYDLCEQSLIYHLYLLNLKNNPPKKSVLFIQFDKLVVNASVFNEGAIFSKLKGKKEKDSKWKSSYFNNIKTNDVNGILDFLENANDTFEGIDLALSYIDNSDEEKKNKLLELFEIIKKHCQEKISPPIEVFVYEQNEIANNVFKYMNLFYNN